MSSRTRRATVVALLVAASLTAASLSIATASAATCSQSGGIGTSSTSCTAPHPYVNPLKPGNWQPGRIDMGVDLAPTRRVPVVAIGDARILGSDSRSSWPGGHFIWYRILDGDHAGSIVYVAEHLTAMVPAGTRVIAGQRIAAALPGYPYTEWGWATKDGQPRAAPCYREGMETNSGRQMARFLRSLGARPAVSQLRPGPNRPSGRLC